jgi:hypothetical protein
MKKLIIIVFFTKTYWSLSQIHLDSLFFNKINEYPLRENWFKLFISQDSSNIAKIVSEALAKTKSNRFDKCNSPSLPII